MPQPSRCGPVRPPRCIRPVKLKTISVGTLALMPSSSHMTQRLAQLLRFTGQTRLDTFARQRQKTRQGPPQQRHDIAATPWNQMQMQVGYMLIGGRTVIDQEIDALLAITGRAQGGGHALRQRQQLLTGSSGEVFEKGRVFAADDQDMGRAQGKDIQQDEEMLVLVDTLCR